MQIMRFFLSMHILLGFITTNHSLSGKLHNTESLFSGKSWPGRIKDEENLFSDHIMWPFAELH